MRRQFHIIWTIFYPKMIKLDMHLIRDIDKDETKQLLCKAMVDFCKSAGILSVAEGVETEEELETLISLRTDYAQGYFLGIPRFSFAPIASEKVDMIQRLAMQRTYKQLYNPIVVERDGTHIGIVTVKDLLDTCTKIEVDAAMHSNPLTGLPGNLLLEKEITSRIFADAPYCITYYDIDNFKAYNDAYGFQNGDLMLSLTAEILKDRAKKNEFIGHIGGDDFIVICDYHEGKEYCEGVIDEFARKVTNLYRDEDVKNGYIISKNRNGVTENFPIASLSIAGVSNRATFRPYLNVDEFSHAVAQLKKKCKKQLGNYFEIV